MARINDEIKVKFIADTTELEKAKQLINELKKLGLKKKTLNLLIKDVCEVKDE